ncbi:hypothetical protein BRC60_07420 [Halobacteriales archaeon QH_1_68_42]|jgi:hypothetical protein|nr:MAG: hypothetical protein BRC60_07420 [Halobacteriales archaeon QH_1_68_42]
MSEATDVVDETLRRRARALLEPGEIELVGVIVPMDVDTDDEPALHQHTVEVGDVIAERSGYDPADTYVYSGNDDPEFGVNQHQGLTVEADEFVWECQQLLRDRTYVVVFYYEADADQSGILTDLEDAGFEAVGVEPAE